MTALTLRAAPLSAPPAGGAIMRAGVAIILAVLSFAIVATPATETVVQATPDAISSAVSAVLPDFIEDAFTASEAEAWGWLRGAAAAFTGVVVGAAVGGTCAAGVVGFTGGIGGLAAGACANFGAGAGAAAASLWY